jgi:signal transduction histidine kinase
MNTSERLQTGRLQVLLLEDSDADAVLFGHFLGEAGFDRHRLELYTTVGAFERRDRAPADVVFADLSLPDAQSLETLRRVKAAAGLAPVVVLTGNGDPALPFEALEAGAEDYLVKGRFDAEDLARCIRYSIARATGEQALRATADALARSNQELEEYAAIVAHDLRAPVRTARVLAELMKAEASPNETLRDYGERLSGCLQRLDALVIRLLDYASMRDACPQREQLLLSALVAEVTADLGADLAREGARIEWTDDPITIAGDRQLLYQLLHNVVENAVKYRRPDEPPVIRISAASSDGRVQLRVTDNGVGVPQEQREHVFGILNRLHSRSEIEGLGLGLALCRRIVDIHGGSIHLEDGFHGTGTTVCIALPDDAEHRCAVADQSSQTRARSRQPSANRPVGQDGDARRVVPDGRRGAELTRAQRGDTVAGEVGGHGVAATRDDQSA